MKPIDNRDYNGAINMIKLNNIHLVRFVRMLFTTLVSALLGLCIGIAFYKTIPTVCADCTVEKYIYLEKVSVTSSGNLTEELIQEESEKWPSSATIYDIGFAASGGFLIEFTYIGYERHTK